jgi:hypothetical protein
MPPNLIVADPEEDGLDNGPLRGDHDGQATKDEAAHELDEKRVTGIAGSRDALTTSLLNHVGTLSEGTRL